MPNYPIVSFHGRDYERKRLRKAINSKRAELGFIYGRRRVGKSTLLHEIGAEYENSLMFEALQEATRKEQIDHFMRQLSEQTQTPLAVARDWQEAFSVLGFYLKEGQRFVVLDEFPWMANGRKTLVSLLKYFWDNQWKKNRGLTVVICGSIAQFMVKHLVHSEALHNRKTFEFRLDPLPAREAKLFFKDYRSEKEIARFLMAFGGVPKYLEQVDPTRSIQENLDELVFRKDGFFVEEFETIFNEQFRVTKTYQSIVETLAGHSTSPEKLAKQLKMPSGGGFGVYLENLELSDFVRILRSPSVSGTGRKTRRVYLWDNWLRFYFHYVRPNKKAILANDKPGLFERLVAPSFETWCGFGFEHLCLQNITNVFKALKIPTSQIIDYGPFFRQGARRGRKNEHAGAQIDILVRRRGDILTLIECKFRSQSIGVGVIEEVRQKVKMLHAPGKHSVERVLLTSGEITPELEREGYFHRVLGLECLFGD